MACLLYNTGKCLQLLLFNRPNFGVHFITRPLTSRIYPRKHKSSEPTPTSVGNNSVLLP